MWVLMVGFLWNSHYCLCFQHHLLSPVWSWWAVTDGLCCIMEDMFTPSLASPPFSLFWLSRLSLPLRMVDGASPVLVPHGACTQLPPTPPFFAGVLIPHLHSLLFVCSWKSPLAHSLISFSQSSLCVCIAHITLVITCLEPIFPGRLGFRVTGTMSSSSWLCSMLRLVPDT